MRQWKTISSNEYIIDKRKREDILKQIEKLSHSYTPEWRMDLENPDMGSVIALLFADQMQENLKYLNTVTERDYVELINMLGVSLKPAYPAHSVVLMDVAENTVSGFKLQKGTKVLATFEDGDSENIIFETAHNIYITESKISNALMVSAKNDKVIPLIGDFKPIEYLETDRNENSNSLKNFPFTLFDFSGEGYGKNGVLLYHSHLFDVQDNDIWIEMRDAEHLVNEIISGRYGLYYYTEDGFERITDVRKVDSERIVFQKSRECKKVKEDEKEYSVLLLEPTEAVEKDVTVSEIRLSSSGKKEAVREVWNGNTEMDGAEFLPFGDTLSLFKELYLGHEYFSKPGAQIKMSFQLEFDTHMVALPQTAEDTQLKVIKRKPQKDTQGAPAEVYADEISIEYYNGIGWRKLKTETPVYQLFRTGKRGYYEITFTCPKDWKDLEIGGFHNRCIRIQLLKADNCYYQPAIHHYPVIKNLQVSYTYEQQFEKVEKLVCLKGSKRWDMTDAMNGNTQLPLFSGNSYSKTALYIGFDKKMEDGPVSMMFRLGEVEGYQNGKLTFSYSTREGFSRLKLTDHTDGLSHTGTMLFMPPSDMAKRNIEGVEAYWIQITDENRFLEEHPFKRPVVHEIAVNAVEVDNIETLEEDEYYMDSYGPNMSFPLNARNILFVDVWVNETNNFSESDMKRMIAEKPDRVRAEYNFLGEITEFYVKWDEVSNFDRSLPNDRHFVVDRMNSMLYFGDGVHVRIPKNTSGVAFKVAISCCDGSIANVGKGQIQEEFGNMMFVERISNPVQAYGGMDMETVEEALRRGTTLLNSRRRLVSTMDYESETLNFSHRIAQAKVVTGQRKDGTYDPGAITLAILMDDYKEGAYSFINMRRRLKEHLLSCCELSVDSEKLEIVEPFFIEVSVEVWVKVVNVDDTFEVQQAYMKALEDYLDPILNDCWEIGRVVSERQIELRLNMEKKEALIRKTQMTVRYKGPEGYHEEDLRSFSGNPYVLVTSGVHKIHFE